MQDIIQKIIEIDRMAQKLTDETIELRREAEASIEEDKKAMREQYIEKARARIKTNTEAEEVFLKQSLAEIAQKRDEIAAQLNSAYEEKHAQWADEIYKRVVAPVSQNA